MVAKSGPNWSETVMTIYTVHAPPSGQTAPDPERFEFVRDGFYFWAFVFGPLWLLAKRLWLALLIYIAVAAALHAVVWLIGVPRAAQSLVSILLHLLLGFEAATMRRWTLELRGWGELGVVSGDRYETAERRFFDSWVARVAKPAAPLPPPPQPP